MTIADGASIHATAVLVGNHAVLIRGPSGSGKSRLALDLLLAGRAGQIAPSVLIGDDRVHLLLRKGQLVVRPARELASRILATSALPAKATADALHIAVATVNGLEFLLTWNCTHIANGFVMRAFARLR